MRIAWPGTHMPKNSFVWLLGLPYVVVQKRTKTRRGSWCCRVSLWGRTVVPAGSKSMGDPTYQRCTTSGEEIPRENERTHFREQVNHRYSQMPDWANHDSDQMRQVRLIYADKAALRPWKAAQTEFLFQHEAEEKNNVLCVLSVSLPLTSIQPAPQWWPSLPFFRFLGYAQWSSLAIKPLFSAQAKMNEYQKSPWIKSS